MNDIGNCPSTPVRICMLHDYYLPLFSGAAIHSHRVSQKLIRGGYKVFVVTPRYDLPASHEVIDGIPAHRISVLASNRVLVHLSFCLLGSLFLLRHRREFDVLHSFAYSMYLVPLLLLAKVLGKLVFVEGTIVPAPSRSNLKRQLRRIWLAPLRWLDGYISMSSPISKVYLEAGLDPVKLTLVHTGVDTDQFKPVNEDNRRALRLRLGLDPEAIYISCLAMIVHRKGIDILVRAFIELSRVTEHVNLLLIGAYEFTDDGAPRNVEGKRAFVKRLQEEIGDAKVGDRIQFLGEILDAETYSNYLSSSNIFVFPSRREGMPGAVLEAMALGLPCVVSAMHGVAYDIFTPGVDGIVIDDEEPSKYAHEILALIHSPEKARRLGQEGRKTVEAKLSLKQSVNNYARLYDKRKGKTSKR